MANPEFHYQPMFDLGPDKTEYYLLTKDYVSVSEFEGKPILKIEKEGLTAMANAAFRDVSFLLRRAHNEQVAKILNDPEASDNDKYVALTFLRNAEVSAKGKLPLCQDTGTAIIHGEKGQQVWTGFCDEEALSLGVYKTYTEENLRYSQNAPLDMYNEVNTRCNLPAQIDTEAERTVVLCEELTHALHSYGDILADARMERRTREHIFDRLIGIGKLLDAALEGCREPWEFAEYFGVPEDFFVAAMKNYRERYGTMTKLSTEKGEFMLSFEPTFRVRRLFSTRDKKKMIRKDRAT